MLPSIEELQAHPLLRAKIEALKDLVAKVTPEQHRIIKEGFKALETFKAEKMKVEWGKYNELDKIADDCSEKISAMTHVSVREKGLECALTPFYGKKEAEMFVCAIKYVHAMLAKTALKEEILGNG